MNYLPRLLRTSDKEGSRIEKEEQPMEKSTTGQSNNGQPQVETLHTRIASFEHLLNEKAVFLDKKRCSTNNYVHWKARGSQQTLWEVTRYLRVARRFYCSPSALHTALQEYLECS